jgi:hypothetical protein
MLSKDEANVTGMLRNTIKGARVMVAIKTNNSDDFLHFEIKTLLAFIPLQERNFSDNNRSN